MSTELGEGHFQSGIDAYNRGDFETTLREMRPLADEGDFNAQFQLAILYSEGKGVAQDDERARQWYEKAAVQGHSGAQYFLGVLYDAGRGGPQDHVRARQWWEKAAVQENRFRQFPQFNLGLLYYRGEGVPQDYAQARQWYEKAAVQEYALAQFQLGALYGTGKGGTRIMGERGGGGKKPRHRAMQRRSSFLGRCMRMVRACRRILSRPTCGLIFPVPTEKKVEPNYVIFSPET